MIRPDPERSAADSLPVPLRGEMLVVLALATLLLTVRLGVSPAPWFDEGFRLNAARTLAERGAYGTYTARGVDLFDPAITIGPTVILPLAFAFRLFGTGLVQARLVIAGFALLAVCTFHALARRLYGPSGAAVLTLAWLAVPDIGDTAPIATGRQVLGEVPALAMMLVGCCLLFDSWRTPRVAPALLAGAAFALGLIAKMQIAFGLVPALGIVALARSRMVRGERQRALVPVATAFAVIAVWLSIEHFANLPAARSGSRAVLVDGIRTNLLSAHFGSQLSRRAWAAFLLLMLASAVVLWLLRRTAALRRLRDEEWMELLLALTGACTAVWFAALSVGWLRYVFVPFNFIVLLLCGRAWNLAAPRLLRRPRVAARLRTVAVAALAVSAVAVNGRWVAAHSSAADAQAMAAYIGAHVPRQAVVETWEWELDALGPHWQYSHPGERYVFEAIREHVKGGVPEIHGYDILAADPDFLVRGPFSDFTRLYPDPPIEAHFELVTEIGLYRLYHRRRPAAGAASR